MCKPCGITVFSESDGSAAYSLGNGILPQQTSVPVRLQIRQTDAMAIQKISLVVINCAGTVVDMFNTTTESMELTYT